MALNDIFTMIKADKYTQDGREELIKAQQAETEDKTYKPGDISERTGKQKQPDGSWKFPKQAGGKKDAAKPTTEELNTFKDIVREYKKNPNKQTEQIMNEAKSHLMKNRGMTPEQLGKIGREVMAESKPSEFKIQGMTKEQYIPWAMEAYKIPEREAKSIWAHGEEQHKNKMKEKEYDGIPSYDDFDPLRDSAPRVLTGDCKIRIRK